jgi:hypothetical protein
MSPFHSDWRPADFASPGTDAFRSDAAGRAAVERLGASVLGEAELEPGAGTAAAEPG